MPQKKMMIFCRLREKKKKHISSIKEKKKALSIVGRKKEREKEREREGRRERKEEIKRGREKEINKKKE